MLELIEKQLPINKNRKLPKIDFLLKNKDAFNKWYRKLDLDTFPFNEIITTYFLNIINDDLYNFRFETQYGNLRLVDYIAYIHINKLEFIEENILKACFLSNPNFCVIDNSLINKNKEYLTFQNCRNRVEFLENGNFLNLKDNNISDKKELFSYYLYLSGV